MGLRTGGEQVLKNDPKTSRKLLLEKVKKVMKSKIRFTPNLNRECLLVPSTSYPVSRICDVGSTISKSYAITITI